MRCETLDRQLSASFEDPGSLEGELEAHVAGCLRCQAELARYRRLRTELAGLRPEPPVTTDGLLDDILGALDASARARALLRRGQQAAACALLAAASTGAIVLISRVRNRPLTGRGG